MSAVVVDESSVALGRLIREARNKKNLSQAVVGRAVGTEQQTVAKIESGASGLGSPYIWKMIDYLGIRNEVNRLVGEAEQSSDRILRRVQQIERPRRLGNDLPIILISSHKALVETMKAIEGTLANVTLENAFASVTHARLLAQAAIKSASEK